MKCSVHNYFSAYLYAEKNQQKYFKKLKQKSKNYNNNIAKERKNNRIANAAISMLCKMHIKYFKKYKTMCMLTKNVNSAILLVAKHNMQWLIF